MKEKLFSVTDRNTGHLWEVFTDGSTSGFEGDYWVTNHYPILLEVALNKQKHGEAIGDGSPSLLLG